MLKTLYLIALLVLSLNLFGQHSKDFFSIGITPTYLLDPITPSIGFSLEKKITRNVHLELMYGFDPDWKLLNWHPDPTSTHHEYKLAFKYLFNQEENEDYFIYVGGDFFGNYNEYERRRNTYQEKGEHYSFDRARIIRSVYGVRVNYGLKTKFIKRFWLEIYSGVGGRYRVIQYFPEGKMLDESPPFDEWIVPFDRNAGRRWTFAFIIGLKVEYRIF